jgi:nitrate/nitrite transporter NarK
VLLLGVFLGVAGASFAVSLPLASQWYPPQHQGKAMGIAGAGNSGTVFAALLAPVLAAAFGWNNVFGFALMPLLLTLVLFALLARNAPNGRSPRPWPTTSRPWATATAGGSCSSTASPSAASSAWPAPCPATSTTSTA